jgi:hypothetical protein
VTFRNVLVKLAADTEAKILRLWERHRAGMLTRDGFITAAAAVIARADQSAVRAADLAVAAAILRAVGETVGPVGVTTDATQEKFRRAIRTVLDDPIEADDPEQVNESVQARLGRLARAEPLAAGQAALTQAMSAQGVDGWVRVTGPDPCPLCQSWADGVVRSPTVAMLNHVGCACVAQPVIR